MCEWKDAWMDEYMAACMTGWVGGWLSFQRLSRETSHSYLHTRKRSDDIELKSRDRF